MFAQINHMAMNSPQFPMILRFYEAVFGLRPAAKGKPISGGSIGDGYCGLNVNPLRDGYVGGLDHFGMTVDDVGPVMVTAPMRCLATRSRSAPRSASPCRAPPTAA